MAGKNEWTICSGALSIQILLGFSFICAGYGCSDQFQHLNGSFCFFHETSPATFQVAFKNCSAYGGFLLNTEELELYSISHYEEFFSPGRYWLNVKRISNFYHWLSPRPSLIHGYVTWKNDTSITYKEDCAVLDIGIDGRNMWVPANCEERSQYICLYRNGSTVSKYSKHDLQVIAHSTRKTITFSHLLSSVYLTCRVILKNGTDISSSMGKTEEYVWSKNDIILNGESLHRMSPNLASGTYTHLKSDLTLTKQGHYRCGVLLHGTWEILWSSPITVAFHEYHTFLISFWPKNLQGSEIRRECSNFALETIVSDLFSQAERNSTDSFSISFAGSSYTEYGPAILGYAYVKKIFMPNLHFYEKAVPKTVNYTGEIKLPFDVIFLNATNVAYCGGQESEARFYWSGNRYLFADLSEPFCLRSDYTVIGRKCNLNFTHGAKWQSFDYDQCEVRQDDFIPRAAKDKYISDKAVTWSEAYDYCKKTGGHLTVSNITEHEELWTDIRIMENVIQHIDFADFDDLDGKQDKSDRLMPLKVSLSQQPQEICFVRNSTSILSEICSAKKHFRCKYELGPKNDIQIQKCPDGSLLDVATGAKCFWIENHTVSFSEAANKCKEKGGQLATFKNRASHETVLYMIKERPLNEFAEPNNPEYVPTYNEDFRFHFWIGIEKKGGHFYWIDGTRVNYSNWHPDVNYDIEAGTLSLTIMLEYAPLDIRWKTYDPEYNLPFICEKNTSNITDTEWIRTTKLQASANFLNLGCKKSDAFLPDTEIWYKDGLAISGARNNYKYVDLGHRQDEFKINLMTISPFMQGYYWCDAIAARNMTPVRSTPLLVTLPGILTFVCIFDVTTVLDFSSKYNYKDFVSGWITLENGIPRLLNNSNYSVNLTAIEQTMNGFKVFFHVYVEDYNTTIQQTLLDLKRNLGSALQGGRLRSVKPVPESIRVLSSTLCLPEVTQNHGLQKQLSWPETNVGTVTSPVELCITGDYTLVQRKCSGNFSIGAVWEDVAQSCDMEPSSLTKSLGELLTASMMNKTTIEDASSVLKNLTSTIDHIEPADVSLASNTLTEIARPDTATTSVIRNVAAVVSNLLSVPGEKLLISARQNATSKIVDSIEQLTSKLNETNVQIFEENVYMGKVLFTDTALGVSINMESQKKEVFNSLATMSNDSDVDILFPEDIVAQNEQSAGISVLKRSDLFYSDDEISNSIIIIKLQDQEASELTSPVTLFFGMHGIPNDTTEAFCVFWDVEKNDRFGGWSEAGCRHKGTVGTKIECQCNHLSSFALLFRIKPREKDPGHQKVLKYLTLIGVSLSSFGLLLVILTFLIFRKWRQGMGRKILFHLSLSLLGSLILFLTIVNTQKNTISKEVCVLLAALMHYFLLVSFVWMFIEGILQYLRFVKVIGAYIPRFVLKGSLAGWGAPLIVVIVAVCSNFNGFTQDKVCWLKDNTLYFAFLLPVGLLLTGNMIIFSIVVYNIYCNRQRNLRSNQDERELAKAQVKATFCIVFLLGITWVFGFFSAVETEDYIFECLFVIFSSLQGFVIFLFHVAREKNTRGMWLKVLKIKVKEHSSKKSSSSSKTTASTTTGPL